jgi:hypothetical protein
MRTPSKVNKSNNRLQNNIRNNKTAWLVLNSTTFDLHRRKDRTIRDSCYVPECRIYRFLCSIYICLLKIANLVRHSLDETLSSWFLATLMKNETQRITRWLHVNPGNTATLIQTHNFKSQTLPTQQRRLHKIKTILDAILFKNYGGS